MYSDNGTSAKDTEQQEKEVAQRDRSKKNISTVLEDGLQLCKKNWGQETKHDHIWGHCPRNPALSTEIPFVQLVGEILTIGTPSSFRSLSVMCRSAAISTCKMLKDCSWSVVQAINPYHTTYLWAASFLTHQTQSTYKNHIAQHQFQHR
jgi:hypothetical protein